MSRVRAGKRIVTGRAVPDIAADGAPDSGLLTGYIASGTDARPGPYRTEVNAGTSLASGGASPAVDVFDSQERASTQHVTAKGYDTMTGVGTPDGAAFITGLRRAAGCSQ